MKQYLIIFALSIAVCTSAFAQKEKEDDESATPPTAAKSSFMKAFPGSSKVKWRKEGMNYEVNFKQNGHEMSAVYDQNSHLQETELEMMTSELPASVTSYVRQHYNGAKITEAAKITRENKEVNYEAEVNGKDLIFDANGKLLKENKDED